MRLKETLAVAHIPGYENTNPKKTLEWVCPDCDYFEEFEGAKLDSDREDA
jgi:hypothetical protein